VYSVILRIFCSSVIVTEQFDFASFLNVGMNFGYKKTCLVIVDGCLKKSSITKYVYAILHERENSM
jgi:hypothetical protein